MKKIKKIIKKMIGWKSPPPRPNRHRLVGKSFLSEMKREFQIDFLKNQGLLPHHTFLDVGCGTLRGGIPIIEHLSEGNYIGIDIRKEVLVEAKKELEQEGLASKNPELIHFVSFGSLQINRNIDVAFAFSVLIHLEDAIAKSCFDFIGEHLSDSGVFYANVCTENRPEGLWQGFPVVFRSTQFYKKLAEEAGLEMTTVGKLKDLGHITNIDVQDNQVMLKFIKK